MFADFPGLETALLEAHKRLGEIFGASNLSVEKFIDPESVSNDETLFLVINTDLDVDSALSKMDGFLDDWVLREPCEERLQFSLEFVA